MERADDLDTRPSGSAPATGARAAGSETIAGEGAAGNERLQHSFGLRKTMCRRREAQLMRSGLHLYEAVRGCRQTIDGQHRVGSCNGELVITVVGEQILSDDAALEIGRASCR